MSEILNDLISDGFLMRDDLLQPSLFRELSRRTFESWASRAGWNTLSRTERGIREVALLDENVVKKIGHDLVHKDNESDFRYLFHLFHESSDTGELIRDIRVAVTAAWGEPLKMLLGENTARTNFSLTCYTPGCFLDPHTDYSDETNYRATLILYFGTLGPPSNEGALRFRYKGKDTSIAAKENRGVLFVPSEETLHWVPQIIGSSTRLAFSGWYL